VECVCFRINGKAWGFLLMERAADFVMLVGVQVVVA
jgi:hypothetical protein